MINKSVKLYLGNGYPVRIPVSQFDTMWQFVFTIIKDGLAWTIPTGATAVLNGLKPDGNVFAFSGTISGNTVTVDADVQMTAFAGDTICELSILSDGLTVGTANFVLAVEAAPKSPDDVSSESTLPVYEEMLQQMENTAVVRFPSVIKSALLSCFRKVAWVDAHGQDYYDNLFSALYGGNVVSIDATFTPGSATIYDTDSLDSLKQYLVVTAYLESDTTVTLGDDDYTLSGTLTAGTNTITVSYGGKTDTFTVTVTHARTIDDVAYGTLTYRDIFVTNNLFFLSDFEGPITLTSTYTPYEGDTAKIYKINAGSPTITQEDYNSETHSLKTYGSSSAQIVVSSDGTIAAGDYMICAAVNCERYSSGRIGVQFGAPINGAVEQKTVAKESTTDGFEAVVDTVTIAANRANFYAYVGSMSSANLDGYVDDVVIAPLPSGMTPEQARTLYGEYLEMIKSDNPANYVDGF